MDATTVDLPLIDEASLRAALEVAPGGRSWEVVSAQRVSGTGWDLEMQLWKSGEHERHVAFRGPTVTGLSDADLEAERQRLVHIRDAAHAALMTVEGHQRFPPGAPVSEEPPDLAAEAVAAHHVLQPFLLAGADVKALTRAFRPLPDDYARVFRGDIASGMRSIYDGIWETDPCITRKSGQNVILVRGCMAEAFLPGNVMMESFPGGYAGFADYAVAGRVWIAWKFVVPGERLGMAWDGLVHLDDRWAWFPRPWAFLKRLMTN